MLILGFASALSKACFSDPDQKELAPVRGKVHFTFVFAIYHRLSQMFTAMRKLVAAQRGPRPSWHMSAPPMSGHFIFRIGNHLTWLERRLDRAIARAAAGLPPRPSRPGRLRRAQPERVENPLRTPLQAAADAANATLATIRKLRLPRREYWLIAAIPNFAVGFRDELRAMMETPELAPHLTHPSVNRLLRPLCRMLGLSAELPPPTSAPRALPSASITPAAPPGPPPPKPPRVGSGAGQGRTRHHATHDPPIPASA